MINEIVSPDDLKKLSISDLEFVAQDVRNLIIDVTSKNGGHIAPSLGTVESTIAMHYLFDSPSDKFIWDVGHQCYAHKILTGRRDEFKSLRKLNGISGFPKREESEHDILNTGHSSTSICVSAGIAHARDMQKKDFYILPFIGDGALTGGIALEGLNYSGNCQFKNFIIVLNDNKMSISENVGAISRYLRKIKLYGYVAPNVYKMRDGVDNILKSIPTIGKNISNLFGHISNNVKNLITPGAIFQDLGFEYIGPINGHNFSELIEGFKIAKIIKSGPVLLHIKTIKGKGYCPAMKNPSRFHGLGPFKKETGELLKKSNTISYSNFFGNALVEEARNNKKIVAITAAMPDGTGLTKFKNEFPDRFIDCGIAEQSAVDLAVGLALQGKKPVVAIYSTFIQRAFDQLIHDVALQNLPITFILDRGGLVGEDGPTHHGVFDLSFMRLIPNFNVMAPGDEHDLKEMLKFSLNSSAPCSIRIPRGVIPNVDKSEKKSLNDIRFPEKITEGEKITILSIGKMVSNVKKVSNLIKEKIGFLPTIYNYRFVKPINSIPILDAAKKDNIIITVEENTIIGGFGSAVNEFIMKNCLDIKCKNIGIPDKFIQHGSVSELYDICRLSSEFLSERIISFYKENC